MLKELRLIQPVFTLHDDKKGLINARKTFVELGDPTGYKWAMKYLGDYNHWKELMKAKWFKEAHAKWLEELHIKNQAEAIDVIREIAKDENNKQSLQAARYLAERGWEKSVRGRPSKVEIQGHIVEATRVATAEDDDMRRIGLVKG